MWNNYKNNILYWNVIGKGNTFRVNKDEPYVKRAGAPEFLVDLRVKDIISCESDYPVFKIDFVGGVEKVGVEGDIWFSHIYWDQETKTTQKEGYCLSYVNDNLINLQDFLGSSSKDWILNFENDDGDILVEFNILEHCTTYEVIKWKDKCLK